MGTGIGKLLEINIGAVWKHPVFKKLVYEN
jgi:hypothetical protein